MAEIAHTVAQLFGAPLGKTLATVSREQQYEEVVRLFSDLLTVTFDKSSSYLNIVTLGGYAAFFALWSLLGQDLSTGQKFWSALLIGFSVVLFVGFEISKAAILYWRLWKMRAVVKATPDTLQQRVANFHSAQAATLRVGAGIWLVIFPLTVVTGVAGASVLLWAFASKLFAL